jgi:hypothetical protein
MKLGVLGGACVAQEIFVCWIRTSYEHVRVTGTIGCATCTIPIYNEHNIICNKLEGADGKKRVMMMKMTHQEGRRPVQPHNSMLQAPEWLEVGYATAWVVVHQCQISTLVWVQVSGATLRSFQALRRLSVRVACLNLLAKTTFHPICCSYRFDSCQMVCMEQ